MKEDIAILIADLSGQSPYRNPWPARRCRYGGKIYQHYAGRLVGDSHLHGLVGDEIIVISSSPDHLLYTTLLLSQKTSKEEKFLQVHGGLHFGKILKRNNNYFGTTINLASRTTNQAAPGTFWCSHEYVRALSDPSAFTFESKGKHSFKNISEEKEVFELITDHPKAFIIDPVCRMIIRDEANAVQHPEMAGLLFCSAHCMDIYRRNKGIGDN